MKKILLLGFILNVTAVYPQWQLHSPLPIPESIVSSYFFNEEKGIADIRGGSLLVTNNGFADYVRVSTGGEGNIQQYNFVNENTGFIIMLDGIHKTTDGGNTWDKIQHQLITDPKYIYFLNNDTGWISLHDKLLFTSDGGLTWTIKSYINSSVLKFINSETGFRTSYDRFYKTTDEGINWSEVNFPGLKVQDIYVRDDSIILLVAHEVESWGNVRVLLSFDWGETWEQHSTGYDGAGSYNQIFFEDSTIIISHNYKGIRSDDLGTTWTYFEFGWQNVVTHITCKRNVYYQMGYGGTILKSTNRGGEWLHFGSRHSGRSMQFVDSLNGFIAPWFITSDGGNNWQFKDITIPDYIEYFSYHFTTPDDGILTYSVNLYHTTNGGLSWDTINLPEHSMGMIFFSKWEGILFSNAGQGWDYGVRRTTDGGITWGDQVVFNLTYATGFYFAGKNRWFAKHEYDGNGYRTTDGGLSWHDNIFAACHNFTFIDSLNGWGTFPDRLVRTTDGGDTFTEINSNFSGGGLLFTDTLNGWVERYDIVFRTTDGGITWDSVFTAEYPIHGFAAHNGKVFLIGSRGVLYGPSSAPLETEDYNITGAQQYSLSQNYPNPFNPSTSINYSIQKQSVVVIKIFDILGNEIAVLVNEEKPAGEYKVNWDASSLSSGVYFYRLQTDEFTSTKKLLLIQ